VSGRAAEKKISNNGALQKSMEEAEKEMVKLEETIEHINREIIEASLRADGKPLKYSQKNCTIQIRHRRSFYKA